MDNTENKYVCFVMYDTDMNDDKFLYYKWLDDVNSYQLKIKALTQKLDRELGQYSTWDPFNPKTYVPSGRSVFTYNDVQKDYKSIEPKDLDPYFDDYVVYTDFDEFISKCNTIKDKYEN